MNAALMATCMTMHLDVTAAREQAGPVTMYTIRQKAIPATALIPAQPLKIFPKTGAVLYAASPKANLGKKHNALPGPAWVREQYKTFNTGSGYSIFFPAVCVIRSITHWVSAF